MKAFIALIMCFVLLGVYVVPATQAQQAEDILKKGILGAAVGAAAAGASGGKAGKGAAIGAGVNIIGGMLFDAVTNEPVGTVGEVQQMDSQQAYQQGYQQGHQQGFQQGYRQGYEAGFTSAK